MDKTTQKLTVVAIKLMWNDGKNENKWIMMMC